MKIPKSVSATGYNKGKTIRNNIQGVLSKKYGGLDTKHIFDGIADRDIEKNIPVAETTIQTNVDRGFLDKNKLAKLPNLRDGLALSYAAADKGMNRAATRARETAYMESNEPWLKETGTRLLSNDTSGMLKLESPFNINASKTADSKNESYAYKPKEEKTSGGDKTFGDVSSVQNPKIASSNNSADTTRIKPKTGIRFMAETSVKNDEQNNMDLSYDSDRSNTVDVSNNRFSITTEDGIKIAPTYPVDFLKEYFSSEYNVANGATDLFLDNDMLGQIHKYLTDGIKKLERPNNIGNGLWAKQIADDLKWVDDVFGPASKLSKVLKIVPVLPIAIDTGVSVIKNVANDASTEEIIADLLLEVAFGTVGELVSTYAAAGVGSVSDGILAIPADLLAGIGFDYATENVDFWGKSIKEWSDEGIDKFIDLFKK